MEMMAHGRGRARRSTAAISGGKAEDDGVAARSRRRSRGFGGVTYMRRRRARGSAKKTWERRSGEVLGMEGGMPGWGWFDLDDTAKGRGRGVFGQEDGSHGRCRGLVVK